MPASRFTIPGQRKLEEQRNKQIEDQVIVVDQKVGQKVGKSEYATATSGGLLKVRLNGDTLYMTNDGTNP